MAKGFHSEIEENSEYRSNSSRSRNGRRRPRRAAGLEIGDDGRVKIDLLKFSRSSARWARIPAMGKPVKNAVMALLTTVFVSGSAWAITLEEAARQVAKEHDARVLSAKTVTRDGRRVHEIKIVTKDGTVRTVRVPE
jgi:hypothetical protein